jgi:hypothetical protein
MTSGVLHGVSYLARTAEARKQIRAGLVLLLAQKATSPQVAAQLVEQLTELEPEIPDIGSWRDWAILPSTKLLSVVRLNTALSAWIAALPSLTCVAGAVSRSQRLGV